MELLVISGVITNHIDPMYIEKLYIYIYIYIYNVAPDDALGLSSLAKK